MRRSWIILVMLLAGLLMFACANKYLTSGKIAYNAKNYDKAISDFTKALEVDSANAEAHFLLGKSYMAKNDYASMRRHFDAAAKANPKYQAEAENASVEIWNNLFNSGNKNAKDEKWQDALKDFQTAIVVIPTKYEAYTNTGYVWQHLENNDSAYYYYAKAVNLDRTNVKVLSNLASMTFNIKRYDESDSLYAIIIGLDPGNAEAWLRRGEIADQKGDYEQAVTFYNKALELKPDQCDIWFNLGVIYFQRLKKMENAEQAFSRAVDICPEDVNALVNLNVVLISNNKLDDAIARLTSFTQKFPNECVGWDLLSQALLRKGEKEKAYETNKKYEDCKQAK